MKRYISFLAISVAVITSTLSFTGFVTGDTTKEIACPSMQLDKLHNHWYALVAEKDTEKRMRMIREHHRLVTQAKQARFVGGSGEVRDDCVLNSGQSHYDLANMVEMHTMMLDMIER